MLVFKTFSVLTGGKQYLVDGNFQWDFRVPADSVELVLSNVFNTLSTPYGTQVLLRTFGLSQSWIDQPGAQGIMQAKVAVLLAISIWEPRAKVKNIEFFLNTLDIKSGRYELALEVEVDLHQVIQEIVFAPPTPTQVWVLDGAFDGSYPTAQLEEITI